MSILATLILLCVVHLFVCWLFIKDGLDRIFISVFLISTIYYGPGAIWYWFNYRDGTFLGIDWGQYQNILLLTYLGIYTLTASMYSLLCLIIPFQKGDDKIKESFLSDVKLEPPAAYFILFAIGLFAALYVIARGYDPADIQSQPTDPALLIFFQSSDLLIPVILFTLGYSALKLRHVFIVISFVLYALYVGLRYKAILILGPLLVLILYSEKRWSLTRIVGLALGMSLTLAIFAALTIARKKFSGVDMNALSDAGGEDFLFGLFAESNIIFGLGSTFRMFNSETGFAGISPIIDSVVQLVPRFLYPEKDLNGHLKRIAEGLGNSTEAFASATSQPFFAEYYAMFGVIGILIGVTLYTAAVYFLISYVKRYSLTRRQLALSGGLICVFFGYYYFSRGSIAQISKGYIFTILPYQFFLRKMYDSAGKKMYAFDE